MAEEQLPGIDEQVWSYRGYHIKASEFTTAMVHLFRAEVTRANVWRQRLDSTTNWAVVATGASISLAFSEKEVSPMVIAINTLLVTLFLTIEARRYRYYELWSYRVRLMETDFFGSMLVPPFRPAPDWAESLAESLLHPDFPVSWWEAVGRRYRLNYVWIYAVLALAWFFKIVLHPMPAVTMEDFLARAAVGPVPGWFIVTVGLLFNGTLLAMGILTMHLNQAAGEILPRFGQDMDPEKPRGLRAWFRPSRKRQQVLVLVVTEKPEEVGRTLLREMSRGVTALLGKGLYSGKRRAVLMTALTVTEVAHLRQVVAGCDPQAFVVISPAREILGSGFMPLLEEDEESPD